MAQKSIVRNEHRRAWREGNIENIPRQALEELEAKYPGEKGNAKVSKAKETKKAEKVD